MADLNNFSDSLRQRIKQACRELTGSPTAMLRRAILLIPARMLTLPVNVNLLFCLLP